MKKAIVCLLILSLLAAIPLAFVGCKRSNVNYEKYDPAKYTENIDLTKYELVFEDQFEGELNRDVWGDTRQGTRRDGYWTKNLAYTDGNGNLILRTEKRGSRYCSDTHERQITGHSASVVKVKYDDCNPFGMIAGDFGEIGSLHAHSSDLVGNIILANFNTLGSIIGVKRLFALFGQKADLLAGRVVAERFSRVFESDTLDIDLRARVDYEHLLFNCIFFH